MTPSLICLAKLISVLTSKVTSGSGVTGDEGFSGRGLVVVAVTVVLAAVEVPSARVLFLMGEMVSTTEGSSNEVVVSLIVCKKTRISSFEERLGIMKI